MFYEIAQSALTAAAEVIAIAGITGIVAHALYTQHKNFMTEFCPPVAPYQPEVQAEEAEVVTSQMSEPLEVAAEAQPEVQVVELIPQPANETTAATEQPEIDLTALDPTALRKLCTKYEIAWRHARGKNRHATKAMMIHQLSARLTA